MLIPELEPDEEPIAAHSLAVDYLAQHGAFPFHRSNLCLLTQAPSCGGLHADSVRADVVRKRPLTPFPARETRWREIHFHHDWQSSFFPAAEAAIRAHNAYTLQTQPESSSALEGWWTLSERLLWADFLHGPRLGVAHCI